MIIALIPARSGSKRVPGKNIRELAGHPLLAYTIQVAKDSGLFGEHIYVVSDSYNYAEIAESYGANCIMEYPVKGGQDINWIIQALTQIHTAQAECIDQYFILRPTSPFRTVDTLKLANNIFNKCSTAILKAMEPVEQHPKKMWQEITANHMFPYIEGGYHYEPSNTFEPLYVQNASLEIRRAGVAMPLDGPITPLRTEGYEGFDINTKLDFLVAEMLIEKGLAVLPKIQ